MRKLVTAIVASGVFVAACGGDEPAVPILNPLTPGAAGGAGGQSSVAGKGGAAGQSTAGAAGQSAGAAGAAGSSGQGGASGQGGGGGQAGASGQAGGAGLSGASGQAGAGGQSGSAGQGGTGGQSGSAGQSGSGGQSGSAGQGGSGGKSGSAGQAGGSGSAGMGGGSAGQAGQAGSAGQAGAGGGPPMLMGTPDDKAALLAHLALPCTDALDDVYLGATPPSPWDASHRGDIVKCAYDRLVTAAEMNTYAAAVQFPPLGAMTDVHKLRISYWTERGVGVPVLTSSEVLIPALRVADPAPLLTVGHGTVGMADACAPSKELKGGNDQEQTYTFAAYGWSVIQPDYPGLGTPGTPAWQMASDEGHALLDGTRAARKLAKPGFFSTKNVILGHSEGGHAAISAHALFAGYGANGTLDGVVAYAPAYFSQAAFAAIISSLASSIPGAVNSFTMASAVMYIQGHLAALEGEASRDDAFQTSQAAAVDALFDNNCEGVVGGATTGLPSLGINKGSDLFTPQYVMEVGNCGAIGTCSSPLSQTWRDRFVADRPAVDPTVPLYLWGGGKDDTVTPALTQCVIDRVSAETTHFTACGDAEGTHETIIGLSAPWVRAYLATVFLGASPPAACTPYATAVPGTVCPSVPPNNATDPTKP